MKRNSTMLTIAVADGVKPFLVQVAAKEDREGLWNLSSILFPQIGISFKVNPANTGTSIVGDILSAIAEGQREFLARTGTQRETWRRDKEERRKAYLAKIEAEKQKESAGIKENPKDSAPDPKPPRSDNGKDDRDAAFAAFWNVWPRKVARKAAEKAFASAWKKGTISTDTLPAILGAVERSAASEQWNEDGGKFIPHPATWINGERWNDSTAPATSGTTTDETVYFNPEDAQ